MTKPTNEERREVATMLRELPADVCEVEGQWGTEGIVTECHDQTDYYMIHHALLGCLPAEHMHPCDYGELHARLADLIEPEPERTCRNLGGEDGTNYEHYDFGCSACGYAADISDPDYCPRCESIAAAARRIGCGRAALGRALRGGAREFRGRSVAFEEGGAE